MFVDQFVLSNTTDLNPAVSLTNDIISGFINK